MDERMTVERVGAWCEKLFHDWGQKVGTWPYEDAADLALRLARLEKHYGKIYSGKYPPMLAIAKAARVFEAMAGAVAEKTVG